MPFRSNVFRRFASLGILAVMSSISFSAAIAQSVTTIHTMTGTDGSDALAGLVQASDGYFYGVTAVGGAHNLGVVFRVSASGQYFVVYSFTGGSDGSNPVGPLTIGNDGNFYGTTEFGGDPSLCSATAGCGTIFQLSPSGTLKTIHNFAGPNEGAHPQSGLVEDAQGILYGTAAYGGDANSDGTVFKVTHDGTFTTLHVFNGGRDGAQPVSNLVQASDGRWYGAAQAGGANNDGTVFSVSSDGEFELLHTFAGADGATPVGNLLEGSDGNIYGTTARGGDLSKCTSAGCGTAFQISIAGNFHTLHLFLDEVDGAHPDGGLFQADDLYLYGTTTGSGSCISNAAASGCGTIFRLAQSGTLDTIFQSSTAFDRVASNGTLLEGADGDLYGTTPGSPSIDQGNISATVYRFSSGDKSKGAVQLSFDRSLVASNTTVTLHWQVLNARSLSSQQCYANIQSSAVDAGTWTGRQSGSFSAGVYSGAASITPTQDGTYTYALTCGGVETGFATLTVGTPPTLRITTDTLPVGTLGSSYIASLSATGGYGNKTWTINSGLLPVGITLASQDGTISGLPSTAGTFNFVAKVTDEQQPPAEATHSLSLVVSLGKATLQASANPTSITTNQTTNLVALVQGVANGPSPTGTIQFQIDGNSAGPAITVVNGVVAASSPLFTARGSYRITALYSGDANYASSISAPVTLQVTAPKPTVAMSLSTSEIVAGSVTSLHANVAAASGFAIPSGTIQFQANGKNIGPAVTINAGNATLLGQVFTVPGSYAIHAIYSGDTNYDTSVSSDVTLVVDPATAALTITPDSLTLSPQGASGDLSLQVARFSADKISFSVSGLPVNTTYTVGALSGGGYDGTAMLHIQSSAPYHSQLAPIDATGKRTPLYAVVFPGLIGLWGLRRTVKARPMVCLAILTLPVLLNGCGVQFNGTPVGSYTVTVHATDGSQVATAAFHLVVSK